MLQRWARVGLFLRVAAVAAVSYTDIVTDLLVGVQYATTEGETAWAVWTFALFGAARVVQALVSGTCETNERTNERTKRFPG